MIKKKKGKKIEENKSRWSGDRRKKKIHLKNIKKDTEEKERK